MMEMVIIGVKLIGLMNVGITTKASSVRRSLFFWAVALKIARITRGFLGPGAFWEIMVKTDKF